MKIIPSSGQVLADLQRHHDHAENLRATAFQGMWPWPWSYKIREDAIALLDGRGRVRGLMDNTPESAAMAAYLTQTAPQMTATLREQVKG